MKWKKNHKIYKIGQNRKIHKIENMEKINSCQELVNNWWFLSHKIEQYPRNRKIRKIEVIEKLRKIVNFGEITMWFFCIFSILWIWRFSPNFSILRFSPDFAILKVFFYIFQHCDFPQIFNFSKFFKNFYFSILGPHIRNHPKKILSLWILTMSTMTAEKTIQSSKIQNSVLKNI